MEQMHTSFPSLAISRIAAPSFTVRMRDGAVHERLRKTHYGKDHVLFVKPDGEEVLAAVDEISSLEAEHSGDKYVFRERPGTLGKQVIKSRPAGVEGTRSGVESNSRRIPCFCTPFMVEDPEDEAWLTPFCC